MNFLDKAIAFASPEKAVKRAHARRKLEIINAGYGEHGASYSKKSLIGWITRGLSADEDIADNIDTLRARSRDLYMGSPLATGALKTVRTNVVGSGLMLNPQPDIDFLGLSPEQGEEFRKSVVREWELWAGKPDCDAARTCTFYQLQALVLLSALMSGDVFVTLPVIPRAGSVYDLRVSIIEADRVCNPEPLPLGKNIVEGVEIDKYGCPVAYWIAKNHPGATPRTIGDSKQEWTRVLTYGAMSGRKNLLHIMADIERPGQRRGVPMLAPVIEALKQMGRYTHAELMAAVVSGMFTVFVKSDTPDTPIGAMIPQEMQVDKDPQAYELGNGAIIGLAEGESIETANPGRPNANFDGFITSLSMQVGTSLEIPYELLLKRFNSSYSASRAALLEAWKMFRMRREWIVDGFCQPTYEEWLSEAVAKGRVIAPGFFEDPAIKAAWCRAEWYGDSPGSLDPKNEAEAAKIRVEEGFSTREREAAELSGMTFETIVQARAREEEKRKAAGLVQEPIQPENSPSEREDNNDEEVLESQEQ